MEPSHTLHIPPTSPHPGNGLHPPHGGDGSGSADGGSDETTASLHSRGASTPGGDAPAAIGPLEMPAELTTHPRYRLLERLGTGDMGTVYKARHRLMDRLVALKVINRHLVDRPVMVERFRREVRAAARLSHANIVHAYDADQAGGTHFLVMEYVTGANLDRLLEEQGRLPIERACDYARQTALGLQHAFERGMVHRDIKPHNLMLTPEGQVKILDFGLARYVSEVLPAEFLEGDPGRDGSVRSHGTPDNGLTLASTGMGTADYIAPEVIGDARQADIRADIYSLGCTLYRLLAGQVPFPERTPEAKLAAHRHHRPRPLGELRPEVPPELEKVVARMMAKDPDRRYPTPATVAEALTSFDGAGRGGNVLVVDDDAATREAVRLALQKDGYTVSGAANGREALDLLRKQAPPRLILLDLLMPVMDGWQFLRELHGDAALASIPVVILSATDAAQAQAAVRGAAGYLHKPVPLEEVAAQVRCCADGAGKAAG